MARKSATPKPVVTKTICSLCGLDWEKHPDNASALDCIELLKAEVAKPTPITIPYRTGPWTWENPVTNMKFLEGGKGTAARY